jgi:septum site-determining protein MinD
MPRIELVINKIRQDMVRRGDMMSVDDVVDILAVPLLGTIMDDENIVISTNRGEPLAGANTKTGKAYDNIAKRIAGEASKTVAEPDRFNILKWLKKKDNDVHKVQSQGL